MTEVCEDYFIQTPKAVNVQIGFTPEQVHRKNQSHQPEVMIAMQVTDENVIDLLLAELVPPQLVLTSFAAVDQQLVVMQGQVLRGGESSIGRECAAGAKDR